MNLIIRNNWLLFFVFAAIICVVFGNALFNGFVYDDHYLIKDNNYIKSFSHLVQVLSSDVTVVTPIEKASGYYRPLSMFFLMGMYKIWGLNAFGFHFMTLLIHIANTFLLFLIIKKISDNVNLAFITGVIFAVHPVHVESVTPIFNFMGIFSSLFSLSAFLAFIKSQKEGRKDFFILSVFLFACAMFSKEEALALPAVFLLYDFYFLSDFSLKIFMGRLRRYVWFLLPVIFYIGARLFIMQKEAVLGFWNLDLGFSVSSTNLLALQILSTFQIFFNYLGLLVFPFRLSAYYLLEDPFSLSGFQIFSSIFIVGGLIACAFYFAKKDKMVSFFIFLFFISSFMISNIIPVGGLFAERFMYFPSIFYCFLFAYAFLKLLTYYQQRNNAGARFATFIVFIIVVGLYAQAAAARNYVWRNDVILWLDTSQKTPQSYRPFEYLGDAYAYHGQIYYEKALAAYNEALKRPGAPEVTIRNSIGRVYAAMNKTDLALTEFKRALNLNNRSVMGYYNVGITYFFKGEYEKALAYFKAGEAIDKNYFWVYYGMGLVYEKQGKFNESRAMLHQALKLKPDFKMAQAALERLP